MIAARPCVEAEKLQVAFERYAAVSYLNPLAIPWDTVLSRGAELLVTLDTC